MSGDYIPWLGSPEHMEAETAIAAAEVTGGASDALDDYNAAKASFLDRAEAEIERLNAPAPDPWCREESCRYRHWRSGSMPTHERGTTCPPVTEPTGTSPYRAFYLEALGEIVFDGTAEGALAAPGIIAEAALARDLLTIDEEVGADWRLDNWPAGREFVTKILNRHGLIGKALDLDHEVAPAPRGLTCETCEGRTRLDQPGGRFVHHVGTMGE